MITCRDITLPDYIDSSWLTSWKSCKRRYAWGALFGLYPSGQSVHLIAGAAIAAGLEAVRKQVFAPDVPRLTYEEMLEIALPAFVEEWGDFMPDVDHAKSFHNTFMAMGDYLQRYNPYDDVIQPFRRPNGEPAIEYKFSIPLSITHPDTGNPIVFVGRFDMLGVYSHGTGEVACVVDEKSTGSIGMRWADQWSLRGQFLGYCWACQQHGIDVRTAAVRGIAIQKTQYNCATALVEYPQWLIERWYRQTHREIENIVRAYVAIKRRVDRGDDMEIDAAMEYFLPLNLGDACASYGGCAFATLCEANDPFAFTSNFIRHRWNPLEKQPVEEKA